MTAALRTAALIASSALLLSACSSEAPVEPDLQTERAILRAVDHVVISSYLSPAGAARFYAYTLTAAEEARDAAGPGAAAVAALAMIEGMVPTGRSIRATALPGLAARYAAAYPDAAAAGARISSAWLDAAASDGSEEQVEAFGLDSSLKEQAPKVEIPPLRERLGIPAEGLSRAERPEDQLQRYGATEKVLSDHELLIWEPTPTGYTSPEVPDWGSITPIAIGREDLERCRVDGPDPAQILREGYELLYSYDLSDSANWQVTVWLGGRGTVTPPGMWVQMAADAALQQQGDALGIAAAVARATHNAIIIGWDEKYRHNLVRPETLWERLFAQPEQTIRDTPAHPSYPSGHSVISAAAAAIIEERLGADTPLTLDVPGTLGFGDQDVPFANAGAALRSVSGSRVMARFHYPSDTTAGHTIGKCVAEVTP